MAKQVLRNARIFAGGCDLTGANNKIELDDKMEVKDVTTWGSGGAIERLGGLESCAIAGSGFWEAFDLSKVDDAMWAARGNANNPWTIGPNTATASVGDLAYLTRALRDSYTFLGAVGDVAPWNATAQSNWPAVRGQIMHPPGTARTSTGTGTARQLGAVPAGKSLYVCLHVLSVAGTGGPSLTVAVDSDDNAGMTSATTVLTFTPATAISGQALVLPGPTTDDWFRVKWTIAGTTPSFLFVASAGIQ